MGILLPNVAIIVNPICSNPVATSEGMKTPGERLAFAREKAGFASAREAALALGVSVSTYNAHERAGQPGARGFRIDSARLYGRRYGVSPAWLLTGEGKPEASVKKLDGPLAVHMVAVRGKAQAGAWNEFEDFDAAHLEPVPTIPGRWINFEQFAYQVSGPSVDKAGILDGDFVICVPYFLARAAPGDKDMVVVERRRGPTLERTVKRLRLTADGYELWPESTDPRFQTPIRIVRNGDMHEEDGTTVEIVGLVIGRWAPM